MKMFQEREKQWKVNAKCDKEKERKLFWREKKRKKDKIDEEKLHPAQQIESGEMISPDEEIAGMRRGHITLTNVTWMHCYSAYG